MRESKVLLALDLVVRLAKGCCVLDLIVWEVLLSTPAIALPKNFQFVSRNRTDLGDDAARAGFAIKWLFNINHKPIII